MQARTGSMAFLLAGLVGGTVVAQPGSAAASAPVTGPPLLQLECVRGGFDVDAAGFRTWSVAEDGGALRLGDQLSTHPGSHLALELVAPGAPADESTWVFLASDTHLRVEDFRPAGGDAPPGLELELSKGRAVVCRTGPERSGPGWTTVVTTLGGSVRVEVGSALIRAGQLMGSSMVTALRGKVATTRWRKPFEEARVVPAGFRRGVGKMSARAGEALLWQIDPVEFLRPFPLLGRCGPADEACRGPWKPRTKPRGWWR
jgi:hypothetical protein